MKRKVCIVTGSRAEYGLLYCLMREIHDDTSLELQIIATCMHLSPEFGLTYREIEEDGIAIDEKVEILLSSDTPVGISKSIGLGLIGLVFGEVFWTDPVRGLAYSLGALGILIMVLWLKLKSSQVKAPVTGELSTIIGANGITTTEISPQDEGRVKIGTSIWKATSNKYIPEETEIQVIGVRKDRFTLDVKTKKEEKSNVE